MGVKFLAQGNNAIAAAAPTRVRTLDLSSGSRSRYLSATTPPMIFDIFMYSCLFVRFFQQKYVLEVLQSVGNVECEVPTQDQTTGDSEPQRR
jgi:hypothetical protein